MNIVLFLTLLSKDPFCGKGSVLAVANYLGLDSVGVEIKANIAANAKTPAVKIEDDVLKKVQKKIGWEKKGEKGKDDESDTSDKVSTGESGEKCTENKETTTI